MLLDAVFLNPSGIDAFFVTLALAATGMTVGFLWLRRIIGPDPDEEESFWRYRRVDKVNAPSSSDWRPTPGWIATRLAMVISLVVFAFVLLAPDLFGTPEANSPWLRLIGIGLAGTGTLWVFQIARTNPDPDAKAWRYRR